MVSCARTRRSGPAADYQGVPAEPAVAVVWCLPACQEMPGEPLSELERPIWKFSAVPGIMTDGPPPTILDKHFHPCDFNAP